MDLEVKDIRTKDTNGRRSTPATSGWSVDVEGLVVIDPDLAATRDNAEDILQTILSKASVGVVLKAALNGALAKEVHRNGSTSPLSRSAPAGENATNFTITGSGNLTPADASTGRE